MNRKLLLIPVSVLLAALIPVVAQTTGAHRGGEGKQKTAAQASPAEMARGQQVFQQNCSRCHNPPRGFPPQITGTILRHMRVRASLGAADERAVLRFISP